MGDFYKKTLIGYKPKEVEKRIYFLNSSFEKEWNEYNKELVELLGENKKLKQEVEQLEAQMHSYKDMRKQLEEKLYRAHLSACCGVHETGGRFDDMLLYKVDVIKNQQKKSLEIKSSITRLLEQLREIVED